VGEEKLSNNVVILSSNVVILSNNVVILSNNDVILTQLLHFEKFSKKLHLIFSLLAFLAAKSGL